MSDKRICFSCKKRPIHSSHFNAKWCNPCRIDRLKKPRGSMTKEQIVKAKYLIGKMPRDEIAKKLGVSLSNLKRSCKGVRFVYHNKYVANPDLVKKVCAYYEKHGKIKTQKKFPQINVRSIVERYKIFNPRQSKWERDQLIELTRMAGLISFKGQAKYFSRPNAFEGSIRSAWTKKYGFGSGQIHGLQWNRAKYLVTEKCPSVELQFLARRDSKAPLGNYSRRNLYLWVDMEKHLRPETPEFMKTAVTSMAIFQRWIFQSKYAGQKIKKMIRERENEKDCGG